MKHNRLFKAAAILLAFSLLPVQISAEDLLGDGSVPEAEVYTETDAEEMSAEASYGEADAYVLPQIPVDTDTEFLLDDGAQDAADLPAEAPEDFVLPEDPSSPEDALRPEEISSPEEEPDLLFSGEEDGRFRSGEADMVGANSGNCGENGGSNLTWSLSGTILTIKGTGRMQDYSIWYDDSRAPWYSKTVTSLVIEKGVTSIGEAAFYGMKSLTSVTLPSSIKEIGSYAFTQCTKLKAVPLANCTSLTTISDSAFASCTALTQVVLPDSVEEVEFSAFSGCTSLTKADLSTKMTSIDPNLFSGCTKLSEVTTIPNVTKIWGNAFRGCKSLKFFTFGSHLTTIEWHSFSGSGLESLVFQGTSITIKPWAFKDCKSLTSISFPSGYVSLGAGSFLGCSALKQLTFPACVKSVAANAFNGCTSLSKVSFQGTGVTSIEYSAFYNCASLAEITLPTSFTTMGPGAFDGCGSLKTIRFLGKEPAVSSLPADEELWNFHDSTTNPNLKKGYQKVFTGVTATAYREGKYPYSTFPSICGGKITWVVNNKAKSKISFQDKTIRVTNAPFQFNAKITEGNTGAKLTYTIADKSVATVTSSGKCTLKSVGRTKVTATAPESDTYAKTTKTITLTVLPPSSILDRVYDKGNGSWRAIIREVSGIDNYQLMWSTTSDFKSYKTASLKPGTHSYTRKDLIPGKTYYIKVRTCKVVNGEKFYSFWSGVKSVKLS